jgi:hypothetical protein
MKDLTLVKPKLHLLQSKRTPFKLASFTHGFTFMSQDVDICINTLPTTLLPNKNKKSFVGLKKKKKKQIMNFQALENIRRRGKFPLCSRYENFLKNLQRTMCHLIVYNVLLY